MEKYYSKRYLKEKWHGLKWDMEEVLLKTKTDDDKIPLETIDRVKREMNYYMNCIMKEINK